MIKFTKDSLGKLTFAASCLIGLLSASNTACHADEKVQSPPHAMDRLNFSLDATPDSGYSYSRYSATNKIIDAYVGVGFKSDEPGTGWFGALISTPHRISKWEDVILGNEPDMDQAASALHPFWYGAVRLHAQALDSNGQNHFDPSLYMWTAEGPEPNLLPYSLLNPTHEDNALRLPFVGTPDKYFHFDLGPVVGEQPTGLPKETLVTVNVTKGYSMFPADDLDHPIAFPDGNSPVLGPAKVKIRWHWIWEDAANTDDPTVFVTPASTPITMGDKTTQKAAGALQVGDKIYIGGRLLRYTIIKIETLADGTIKFTVYIDPDDDLFTENGDLQQQIERIQEAYKEAIYTGAQGVKFGLEAYKAVAEFYAYGPFFELGGEIVIRAGAKAVEVLQAAVEARQIAARLRTVDTALEATIVKLRQRLELPGLTPEEIANLNQKIVELEEQAKNCRSGAENLDHIAAAAEKIGAEMHDEVAANGCDLPDGPCFEAGTLINMADGSLKPIERVRVGDQVLSKDIKSGRVSAKAVTDVFMHDTIALLNLRLGAETLKTTPAHPFYVQGEAWVNAGNLALGNAIVARAGPDLPVHGIQLVTADKPVRVYNFAVADYHTYFAGKAAVLVHNQTPGAGGCGGLSIEGITPDPDAPFGSAAHKAAAWDRYQALHPNPNDGWDYNRWGRGYDVLSQRARDAKDEAIEIGGALLPGGESEVYIPGIGNLPDRYVDWAETEIVDGQVRVVKGIEVKAYTSGHVPAALEIRAQVEADARIMANDDSDLRWVFKYNGPNGPLKNLLAQKHIPWKMDTDVVWQAPWIGPNDPPLSPF